MLVSKCIKYIKYVRRCSRRNTAFLPGKKESIGHEMRKQNIKINIVAK